MKKILQFIITVSCIIIPFGAKAAAQPAAFVVTWGDQQFSVDSTLLATWEGNGFISENPAQALQLPPAQALLVNAFGLPQNTTPESFSYNFDINKIYSFVTGISSEVDATASEPSLTIEGNKATQFTPPQDGVYVDRLASTKNILNALQASQKTAELVVSTTPPQTSLESLNALGIKERIAQGVSSFKGSPANRRFNIAVGIEKEKGVIIPPGETFSFNENLGPVDGEHGFKPELVIKSNQTIPEFGGGLCQVSSTTFRAAMQAGLPITERRNHSYAVQYYAPQGTDATIYPGSVDLKFVNDTPGAILVWPYEKDKDTLIFDFYGTKDDRSVTLEKPVVYDRKTDGSMKATWTRQVSKDGQTRTDIFKSTYLPPALFHKQEALPGTGTPTTTNISGLHVGTQ